MASGYKVVVACRLTSRYVDRFVAAGFEVYPLAFRRASVNPISEIRVLVNIYRIYKAVRPDIVHHVALKPILYGSLAARMFPDIAVINAPVGLGFAFASVGARATIAQKIILSMFRLLLRPRRGCVILENPDDKALLTKECNLPISSCSVIAGAGVNVNVFQMDTEAEGVVRVILPARMLWDKGVGEFVAAAKLLRNAGVKAEFILVGMPDLQNPAGISVEQLQAWVAEGAIEWWGYREDMPDVLSSSHVVCLPSYREGLPKALIEAAAAGRAIVASDVPGCREIVRHNDNGLLVPPRDAPALAAALERLIHDPALRARMGARGREIAVAEFSLERVVRETLELYERLLR